MRRGHPIAVVSIVLALVVAGAVGDRPVRADPLDNAAAPDPPPLWPVAGALTALVPLAAGGVLFADDGDHARQHAGVVIMTMGFAAAPWVAHVRSPRTRRALAFGVASLGLSLATVVAMQVQDPFETYLPNHDRAPFAMLLTSAFFAAMAGVVDAFITPAAAGGGR